ncbi:uncharacterized protein LOC128647597 [Bombina bombina]|uniref:uncharacterized protein LOC128647597 n=1 Tax=Bombina bombina TaxID=8345 RepID=UPI00235A4F93|nr:uncharacterized protein LOC128647597 [Bombina bombina]
MTFRGKAAIPPKQLEEAHCYDTAACLIQSYGQDNALMVTIQVLCEADLKDDAKRIMEETSSHLYTLIKRGQFIIFRALINLSGEDLKRFKDKLVMVTFSGKEAISPEQLEEAHCYDTAACLIQRYKKDDALMLTSQALYEVGLKETAKRLMEETYSYVYSDVKRRQFIMFRTLINLSDEDLKRFKDKLTTLKIRGKTAIPRKQLEEAHCYDTAACLRQSYGEEEALMVTIQVLYEANLKDTAMRLMKETYSDRKIGTIISNLKLGVTLPTKSSTSIHRQGMDCKLCGEVGDSRDGSHGFSSQSKTSNVRFEVKTFSL